MIAEVLLIRDENRYLLEHLAYNAAAGVEHFFIYDNMSRTPVTDFLRENNREFLNICTVAKYQGRDNSEAVALMQKHGVNLETAQNYAASHYPHR